MHGPARESGQVPFNNLRVEPGRIRKRLKSHGPDQIGSGGMQMPRVGTKRSRGCYRSRPPFAGFSTRQVPRSLVLEKLLY